MINKLFLLLATTLIVGCENQSYLSKDDKTQQMTTSILDVRNGIAYLPKTEEPFTGKFLYYCQNDTSDKNSLFLKIDLTHEEITIGPDKNENEGLKGSGEDISANKKVCIEENYSNGKRNGLSMILNDNYKSSYKYKDGVLNGLYELICVTETGEKECGATNYKNGIASGITKSYKSDGELWFVSINLGNTPENDIKTATEKLFIDEDKIENHSWYKDFGFILREIKQKETGISAYMGRSKDNSVVLRYKFQYKGKEWLFINSIIIAADKERFEKYHIKTENNYSGIKEWYDILALDEDLKIMKAIINSKETTIRFKGNTAYSDYVVTTEEKAALKNIVEAYEALLTLSS